LDAQYALAHSPAVSGLIALGAALSTVIV
jgi:hypothetical protein